MQHFYTLYLNFFISIFESTIVIWPLDCQIDIDRNHLLITFIAFHLFSLQLLYYETLIQFS